LITTTCVIIVFSRPCVVGHLLGATVTVF